MYCTMRELSDYLGVSSNDDNTLLEAFIKSSQKIIDRHTGRTFEAAADATRYFDAVRDVDGAVLWFDQNICAITSITNGNGVAVSASSYVTEPRNRAPYYAVRLKPSAGISWMTSNNGDAESAITVVGRWAYSTTAPDDIRHACIRLAAYLYRQKDNANDLDRAIVAGNSTILPAQIPSDIRLILDPYKVLT